MSGYVDTETKAVTDNELSELNDSAVITDDDGTQWISIKQASLILKMYILSVRRYIKRGKLTAQKEPTQFGETWLVKYDEVLAMAAKTCRGYAEEMSEYADTEAKAVTDNALSELNDSAVTTDDDGTQWLSIKQASLILKMSVSVVRRYVKRGELTARKEPTQLGETWLIKSDDIRAMAAKTCRGYAN